MAYFETDEPTVVRLAGKEYALPGDVPDEDARAVERALGAAGSRSEAAEDAPEAVLASDPFGDEVVSPDEVES